MRPKAEWAIDSEPIRARGIIVKYFLLCLYTKGQFACVGNKIRFCFLEAQER